jgi:hypothetical protein
MISRRRWRARLRSWSPILALTALNLMATAMLAGPAVADGINYGAGLSAAAADLVYCKLSGGAGCTMVGAIQSVNNADLALVGQGTGSVVIKNGDDNVDIQDSAGTVKGKLTTATASSTFSMSQNLSTGGRVRAQSSGLVMGKIEDATAAQFVACLADGVDTGGGGNCALTTYGAGLYGSNVPQTCDCGTTGTPNTVTCDIQSNVVWLTDGDADACTVTISETTAATINQDVGPVVIKVVSLGGGGSFTIADSANVLELAGGVSWVGDSVGDTLTLEYNSSGSVDAWNELGRANN